jgi:hypothetical protein
MSGTWRLNGGAARLRPPASASHRRLVVPAVAIAAALGLTACGDDDFENEPRPPAPVELTARIDEREVVVSPAKLGAGPVTITVSNQGADPATLTLEGPNDIVGSELPPGGVGGLKATLEEGEYEVSGGPESRAREGTLTVGAERASSQNELLLP